MRRMWIATYPKCGTTWMQQIVLELTRLKSEGGEPLNYKDSPWQGALFRLKTHSIDLHKYDNVQSQPEAMLFNTRRTETKVERWKSLRAVKEVFCGKNISFHQDSCSNSASSRYLESRLEIKAFHRESDCCDKKSERCMCIYVLSCLENSGIQIQRPV